METIKKQLLSFGKIELNTVVVTVFLCLLSLVVLTLTNNPLIFAGILILSAFFIWQTPVAGLFAALLTTMIFGEHFSLLPLKIGDDIYKIYALDFVLIITFFCWFLQQNIKTLKHESMKANRKDFWLLVFFFFLVLTLFRSFLTASDKILAVATFKNYSYLLVYFLTALMLNSKEQIIRLLKIFLWGGVVLIGFVIYGLVSGRGLWSEATAGLRYLSGLHAYYLTFSIIILLVLMAYRQYVFGYFKTLLIFLLQIAGLVGAMFRHLWLGILAAGANLLIWLDFKRQNNLLKIALISFCVLAIIALVVLWGAGLIGSDYNFLQEKWFQSVLGRGATLSQTGSLAESAAGWRLATWKIALEKFLDNPLIGLGFGQKFFFEFRGFVDLVDIRNIHNDFASLLVQLGLLGFAPFLLFNWYQVRDLVKLIKQKDEFQKALALIFSGFYIVALFGIFFAIYLMFNGTSIFYWTVMGGITTLMKNEK
ncbi:MAG: O-antigen ligase family protein [Patescibacteria group bacterium]|nr:O-antigen ligase family protein [Patescibacteria group bacterium]